MGLVPIRTQTSLKVMPPDPRTILAQPSYGNDSAIRPTVKSGDKYLRDLKDLVYAAIDLRSDAIGKMDRRLYIQTGADKPVLVESEGDARAKGKPWAYSLLHKGNELMGDSELWILVERWMMCDGNAYLLAIPDDPMDVSGSPSRLYLLPSPQVRIAINKADGAILGYQFTLGRTKHLIPGKFVVKYSEFQPTEDPRTSMYYGVSRLFALRDSLDLKDEAIQYLQRQYKSDAIDPFILKYQGELDVKIKQGIKAAWQEHFPETETVILDRGGNYEQVKTREAPSVIGEQTYSQDMKESVASVFGIPYELLVGKSQNRAASMEQKRLLMERMDGVGYKYDEGLTRLLQGWDSSLLVEHPAYVDVDAEEKRKEELHLLTTGQVTINDLRAANGQDGIGPEGDERFLQNNVVPLKLILNPPTHAPAVPSGPGLPAMNALGKALITTDEDDLKYWKQLDDINSEYADRLKKKLPVSSLA